MEKMSDREKQLLRDLQAKAKRVAREEEKFYKDAEQKKGELLKRWGISDTDRLDSAARIIGTDPDTLYDWIVSDAEVAFFRKTHSDG